MSFAMFVFEIVLILIADLYGNSVAGMCLNHLIENELFNLFQSELLKMDNW